MWINLAFMLLVTLVPFATNMMISYEQLTIPIVFYGLNQLLLAVALITNINYLGRRPELAEQDADAGRRRVHPPAPGAVRDDPGRGDRHRVRQHARRALACTS